MSELTIALSILCASATSIVVFLGAIFWQMLEIRLLLAQPKRS